MILLGFPGPQVDEKVLQEVREGKIGSIILFEKNIPPQNSFVALKKIIWTYQQAATIPLLVGIDQEGGRVNRLKDKYGFPRSITAAAMGKSPTLDSVRFYAEATASTLAGLGFNINFGPVVDLATNPNNPIIARHGRAFSANEDSVTLLAAEFIRQHHKYGVLTTLKHFPGHGSSKDDTHLGIADVTNTWEEKELKPYETLIKEGLVDAVMTSHIANKKLDESGHPGTLSHQIITGILRQRLNFDGVVFTDDMQMHAITKYFGLEDAIRLTILGGVDIMCFSNNIHDSEARTVDKVMDIIYGMVQSGTIKRERIDESFKRVMRLKRQLSDNVDAAEARAAWRASKQALEETRAALMKEEMKVKELEQQLSAPSGKKKKKKNKE
jgi:beta-N-acetylhexosaminidase